MEGLTRRHSSLSGNPRCKDVVCCDLCSVVNGNIDLSRGFGFQSPQSTRQSLAHSTQTFACMSRTVDGQPGHSRLQDSMPHEEELDCAPSKRKTINWTPNGRLNSLEHHTGLSASEDFNKVKAASGLHLLQLPIPGTAYPAPVRVQTTQMPVQTLRYR
jgi:hypothetical protein